MHRILVMIGDPLDFIACEESYKSGGGWRSRGSGNNRDNNDNGCVTLVIVIIVIISIVIIFSL